MNFLTHLEKMNKPFMLLSGFVFIVVIGVFDFFTGYEIAFSLFYVIPISLISWVGGRQIGIIASVFSALAWILADEAAGHEYSHVFIPVWNTLIRLGFFFIIVLFLSGLQRMKTKLEDLIRIDSATGAVSSRYFYELAKAEIERSYRYKRPLTIAYFDLDNFKSVNDQYGHATGDLALQVVSDYVKSNIRDIDVFARLGGDEFALLFPETDEVSARIVVSKLRDGLLQEMQKNNWPVTFSIGVLTCKGMQFTTNDLVKKADDLMYFVKHESKNAVKYSTCGI